MDTQVKSNCGVVYYISTGKKGAQYTLRVKFTDFINVMEVRERDEYVMNLGTNPDRALVKANEYAIKHNNAPVANQTDFSLNPYGQLTEEEKAKLQRIEDWKHIKAQRDAEYAKKAEEIRAAREAEKQKSNFVGKVGDKIEITLTHQHSILINEGMYGAIYLDMFVDTHENKWVYIGGGCNALPYNKKTATVKCTIKDHREYKGEKQNVLSRARKCR